MKTKVYLNIVLTESQTYSGIVTHSWGHCVVPPAALELHDIRAVSLCCPPVGWSYQDVMVLSWKTLSQLPCSIPRLCYNWLQGIRLYLQGQRLKHPLCNTCSTVVSQAPIHTTSSWKPSKPVSVSDSVWHLDMTVNGNLQVPQMDRK